MDVINLSEVDVSLPARLFCTIATRESTLAVRSIWIGILRPQTKATISCTVCAISFCFESNTLNEVENDDETSLCGVSFRTVDAPSPKAQR